jgi:hypothetical protein
MTKFRLTKSQLLSIKKAAKEKRKVTLTLGINQIDPNGIELPIDKALLSDGKKHRVSFDPKSGGILPFLPLILTAIGAAGGLAGGVSSAVKNAYEIKKNKEVEASALARQAVDGLYKEELLRRKAAREAAGSGLYLKSHGRGLHLKTGGMVKINKTNLKKAANALVDMTPIGKLPISGMIKDVIGSAADHFSNSFPHVISGEGLRRRRKAAVPRVKKAVVPRVKKVGVRRSKKGGFLDMLPMVAAIAAAKKTIDKAKKGSGMTHRRKRGGMVPIMPLIMGGLKALTDSSGRGLKKRR